MVVVRELENDRPMVVVTHKVSVREGDAHFVAGINSKVTTMGEIFAGLTVRANSMDTFMGAVLN